MLLENENNMAIGKGAINAFYADAIAKGIRILSIDTVYHDIRVSGKYVFSADKTIAKVRAPGMKQLVLAYVKFLTVWEIQPDGSLKIKVDASNYDKLPDSELVEYPKGVSAVKDSFHCPQNNAQIANASKETLDKIRKLEKDFHAAFLAEDIDTIASHYASDIILLPEQDDFIRGREALKAHTEGNLRRLKVESVGDQIICAEGTEEMVFVVNTYLIKMKDKTQNNQELTIPCKGVHVWQKQPDGSWQILMDTFSGNSE
jgi:ketosteroid isomerase-like protein